MTDSLLTPDSTSTSVPARRSYTPPQLTTLGMVEAVTAGPYADGGNIDQLVGGSGGFTVADDGTS